jgi:hypothetical protein
MSPHPRHGVFAQEAAGRLGADFHIGPPAEHDHRVALTVPPRSRDRDYAASAPGGSTLTAAGTGIPVRDGSSVAWRRALVPAASGFGNARSVASTGDQRPGQLDGILPDHEGSDVDQ